MNLVTDKNQSPNHCRESRGIGYRRNQYYQWSHQCFLDKQQVQIVTVLESKLLNQILMILIKQEVRVVDVLQQAPDLETVFLSLTGRNLRD